MYVRTYVRRYVRRYVCMYVCMYVCVYVCIHRTCLILCDAPLPDIAFNQTPYLGPFSDGSPRVRRFVGRASSMGDHADIPRMAHQQR